MFPSPKYQKPTEQMVGMSRVFGPGAQREPAGGPDGLNRSPDRCEWAAAADETRPEFIDA